MAQKIAGGRPAPFFFPFSLLFVCVLLAVASGTSESTQSMRDVFSDFEDRNFLASLIERLDSANAEARKKAEAEKVSVPQKELEEALRVGQEHVQQWENLEAHLLEEERKRRENPDFDRDAQPKSSISYSHPSAIKRHNPEAIAQSKEAAVMIVARQHLSEKLGIPAEKIDIDEMVRSSLNLSGIIGESSERQSCDFNYRFRTFDGTCNSMYRYSFGQSNTIFGRLLQLWYSYSDISLATPRKSYPSGRPLPSPRRISTTITVNDSVPDPRVTLLTMQWGQFLDHDLTLTPTFTKSDGTGFECCSATQFGGATTPPHPECFPIDIPSNDPAYNPKGNEGITCMNFIRSTYGKDLNGNTPQFRGNINALTHWIDGSQVYGSTAAAAAALRDTSSGKGKLKTSVSPDGRQMLPLNPSCGCDVWGNCPAACFSAGDTRVNEQPLLTVMHLIWVREHNRIADQLCKLVPGQTDEYYFQHARRFVIAEMQHIIYNEYLPVMIGQRLAAQVNSPEFSYTPYTDPAVYTEFSTAAFRMGHSQLRSFIRLFEKDGRNSRDSYLLSDSFDSPSRVRDNPTFVDNALRGLLQTSAQAVDNCFADDISSKLFKPKTRNLGLDLISLNLQRGRDHGLPSYTYMLYYATSNYLFNSFPYSFDLLVPRIPQEVVSAMKTVYESIYDIDLFIGGVTEKPLPDAVLGPTFATIFALQFLNSRRSDRFFYNSNINTNYGLSQNQLAEIEKVSLARIICDNSDGTISKIQPKAFNVPDDLLNKPVGCHQLPIVNLAGMLPL